MKTIQKLTKIGVFYLCLNGSFAIGAIATYFIAFELQTILYNRFGSGESRSTLLLIYPFVIVTGLSLMMIISKNLIEAKVFNFFSPGHNYSKFLVTRSMLTMLSFGIFGGVTLWGIMNLVMTP